MTVLSRTVRIAAPPERVFDLVSDVEGFSRHSTFIREIRQTEPGVYRWRVELLGITFSWDSVVSEKRRPERFSWRSREGIFNRGTYELTPVEGGTEVSFRMEYRLTGKTLEMILAPMLDQLISVVATELLYHVKREIEEKEEGKEG